MNLDEIQKEAVKAIDTRLKKKNIKPNVDLIMTHLVEEFGELAMQINNGKLKRKEVDMDNIGEEISDCISLLLYLAKYYNIDLESRMKSKLEEIKNNR